MVSSRRIGLKSAASNRGAKHRNSRSPVLNGLAASNFSDQIQGRRQGLRTRSPLRGAHFARVSGDVLGGFYLAQQFLRIAADSIVVHFHYLDLAGRADDKRTAQREPFFLAQHLEITCERRGPVAYQPC